MLVNWEIGFVRLWSVGRSVVSSCPSSSSLSASSFFLLLSLSPVACAQAQARACCCLSLSRSLSRRLDDATLLPPPSLKTPLLGTIKFFLWQNQQGWLWLVLLFLPFLLSLPLSSSVLLSRVKLRVTGHFAPQSTLVSAFFLSFQTLTAACFLFLLCVYKPRRYISVRAVSDLAGSL